MVPGFRAPFSGRTILDDGAMDACAQRRRSCDDAGWVKVTFLMQGRTVFGQHAKGETVRDRTSSCGSRPMTNATSGSTTRCASSRVSSPALCIPFPRLRMRQRVDRGVLRPRAPPNLAIRHTDVRRARAIPGRPVSSLCVSQPTSSPAPESGRRRRKNRGCARCCGPVSRGDRVRAERPAGRERDEVPVCPEHVRHPGRRDRLVPGDGDVDV